MMMPASGNSTLVMSVVMLVERVFRVSGVVKTLFLPNKKNRRKFFFFHHEQKRVKADFVGVSKSPFFATETQRIYSKLFFLFRKKFLIELVLFFFLFAGENSMHGIELVLFSFLFAVKILCTG